MKVSEAIEFLERKVKRSEENLNHFHKESQGYAANEARIIAYNIAINKLEQIDEPQAEKIDESVKSEKTLKEQLQQKQKDSHRIWFDRWYGNKHLEKELEISALQNYSGYTISISNENDKYLKRRLRDPRTIEMLREKIPSINITYEKRNVTGLFGTTSTYEKILFDWSDKNG